MKERGGGGESSISLDELECGESVAMPLFWFGLRTGWQGSQFFFLCCSPKQGPGGGYKLDDDRAPTHLPGRAGKRGGSCLPSITVATKEFALGPAARVDAHLRGGKSFPVNVVVTYTSECFAGVLVDGAQSAGNGSLFPRLHCFRAPSSGCRLFARSS